MAEETAAVDSPAPKGALVAVAEKLRRSGRERKTATMATTTLAAAAAAAAARRPISPEMLPNDVVMPEETAVVALPAPVRPTSSQGNPLVNYFISKRYETKAANPNASFNDIKAIIQKEWCKLPKEERAKYEYEFESVQAEGELVWQSVLSLELTTFTHLFFC
jgi:hypothetical protein